MEKTKIGVVGTGFIAAGFIQLVLESDDFEIVKVLTRRGNTPIKDIPTEYLTDSVNEMVDASDFVFECSGDVVHATNVIDIATKANKKVVTLNAEFHVTTGSHFIKRGDFVTDADGDQPGCLARLHQEAVGAGFDPVAYVNIKGFINHNPKREDMEFWSDKQGIRLEQTVSFTDGTKLQIEQAFVANYLGATVPEGGMLGKTIPSLNDTDFLIDEAEKVGKPVSDFILCKGAPPGQLIVAKSKQADRLGNYIVGALKTTEKRGYVLLRPYHLCHLEVLNTMRKIMAGEGMLINNTANPHLTVGALAKRPIKKGEIIERGAGGFDVRGVAVELAQHRDAVPVCLLQNTPVTRDIAPGEFIQFDQVDMAPSLALDIYQSIAAA